MLTPTGRLLRRSAEAGDRPALFAAQFVLSHACWLLTYPLAGRLGFIRHARELGFGLPAIRDLLGLADRPDVDCAAVHAIATAQIDEIDSRLRRLRALRAELTRMAERCRGGTVGDCRIIETLADFTHSHCADPDHGRRADPD